MLEFNDLFNPTLSNGRGEEGVYFQNMRGESLWEKTVPIFYGLVSFIISYSNYL
jgi:hypothetical protein